MRRGGARGTPVEAQTRWAGGTRFAYLLYRVTRVYRPDDFPGHPAGSITTRSSREIMDMRGVRQRVGGILMVIGSVVDAPQMLAQSSEEASDTAPPTLAARVDDLDQQIRILQRLRELAADSVAAAAKDRVTA